MLREISQRERQILFVSTNMCNLKNYNQLMNITKRSRLTDTENKLVVTSKNGVEYRGKGVADTIY